MMTAFYIILIGSMTIFGGSAIYALFWAAKSGQFSDMKQGAEVIFGKDEPVGEITDHFPGMDLEAKLEKRKLKKMRKF
ncbi:MAG: cbb3-type cytochrome oxidase assembly protein [Verrucomicrobiota bacterium]